jgi:predicted N-formylglutamate amidohydrolase
MFDRIVLSVEHGGNRIPAAYTDLFRSAADVLASHRGYDIGALGTARFLARKLQAPLFSSTVSRLVVDLNRSPGHRALFSGYVGGLGTDEKARVMERYYYPYRREIEAALEAEIRQGRRVLHLAIHSFVPELDGHRRRADIGLLYDPARRIERLACGKLRAWLLEIDPALRVRRNYPYRGTADGLTTHLRKALASPRYAGIEIELNQGRIARDRERRRIAGILKRAVRELLT